MTASATEGLRCSSLSDPRGDEKKKGGRQKKNEAPFQRADDCSLLAATERSFVKLREEDGLIVGGEKRVLMEGRRRKDGG